MKYIFLFTLLSSILFGAERVVVAEGPYQET